MSGIVCAVRGGPASQPTIAKAITLAKETGQSLCFLYVVNLDFLAQTIMHHKDTMLTELAEMGEFILLVAQEKASKAGVEAQITVRNGKFLEELTTVCLELEADYVVLGRPRGEYSLIKENQMEAVQHTIETTTQAAVVWAAKETL